MTNASDFQTAFSDLREYGQICRFRYYDSVLTAGSYYDDDVVLNISGNDLWVSGIVLPISNSRGSSDSVLLEQGKILMSDSKLYVAGSITTSGIFKVGLGSATVGNPPGGEFSMLGDGVKLWTVNDTDIFKKIFIRRLTTGSFIGEAT